MNRMAVSLEEWRGAERRRDALPQGSAAWIAADDDVRRAHAAYRAEASQANAYYRELDFTARDRSFPRWLVRIDRAAAATRSRSDGDPVAARGRSGSA